MSNMRLKTRMICGVCRSDLRKGEVLWCAECKTPHHADCWMLVKKCAVYGCKSDEAGCSGEKKIPLPLSSVGHVTGDDADATFMVAICLFSPVIVVLIVLIIGMLFA